MLGYPGHPVALNDPGLELNNRTSENSSQFSVSSLLRLGQKRSHSDIEENDGKFAIKKNWHFPTIADAIKTILR